MEPISLVREVEPDELHGYVTLSEFIDPIAWAGIYEDDELVGYGCVSRLHGKAWAHDLKHWGKDPSAVARLYRLLIRLCKERGVSKVMTDVSDDDMANMYKAMGWRLKSLILEGDI